jgi:hypothetical protein
VTAEPDPQRLLTALTTEHFTLQGARSPTVSESASRASLFLFSVSSTLVALGFINQLSTVGDAFQVFALTVLPTLYVLGLFTFVRLVQSVAEDFGYARAINRIRHHYRELAGDQADLFMMSAHDDAIGVLANMGIRRSTWQAYFTTPTMVAACWLRWGSRSSTALWARCSALSTAGGVISSVAAACAGRLSGRLE